MTTYPSFPGRCGKHIQFSHYHILTASRATDLGVSAWYADQLDDLEVVPISALSGHFILAPLNVHDKMLWIAVVYDHVRVSFYHVINSY